MSDIEGARSTELGEFPQIIKKARVARHWTREHLAVYSGISASTVGRLERGEHRPRASVVIALARALDLPVEDLASEVGLTILFPQDKWS